MPAVLTTKKGFILNNELQTQLASILASIQSATAATSDFAMAQLPDIARQYVLYSRVESLWNTVVILAFAGSLFYLSRWAYKNPWNISVYVFDRDKKRSDSNVFLIVMPASVGGLILLVRLLTFPWMLWFAPKVWLLAELARMVGAK